MGIKHLGTLKEGVESLDFGRYGTVHTSVRWCALEPSPPIRSSNSSNVCSGTGLPFLPTAGIAAHLSAALSVKRRSEPSGCNPSGSASTWPIGTQISG